MPIKIPAKVPAKKLNQTLNQQGSITIGMALLVIILGSLMVLQMASAMIVSNRIHERDREGMATAQVMERLAVHLKQSHELALLDRTCASFVRGGAGRIGQGQTVGGRASVRGLLSPRTINGAAFCLPGGNNEICLDVGTDGETVTRACIASSARALNWEDGAPAGSGAGSGANADENSQGGAGARVTTNTMTVPPRTAPIWRSCLGASCVRLALCPEGRTNCSVANARAVQIVRLGATNDPAPINEPNPHPPGSRTVQRGNYPQEEREPRSSSDR